MEADNFFTVIKQKYKENLKKFYKSEFINVAKKREFFKEKLVLREKSSQNVSEKNFLLFYFYTHNLSERMWNFLKNRLKYYIV